MPRRDSQKPNTESASIVGRKFSAKQIFGAYVKARRALPIADLRVETLPYLSRFTALTKGGHSFVQFARLPKGREEAIIREQIEIFDQLGQSFEWKVYDFDVPSDLK